MQVGGGRRDRVPKNPGVLIDPIRWEADQLGQPRVGFRTINLKHSQPCSEESLEVKGRFVPCRRQDQTIDAIGMIDRHDLCDGTTSRMADKMRAIDRELVQNINQIGG